MADIQRPVPTITYDHRDDDSKTNPWPRWQHMRENQPLAYSPAYDGFYLLARYADIAEAARNTEVFSSGLDGTTIPTFPTPKLPPLHSDPPEAREWREIINPHFSPAAIARYEPWIKELVAEVVDPLLASSSFDVPRDIGVPLTRRVILRIMGIEEAPPELNRWTDDMVFGVGDRAAEGSAMMMGFLAAEIKSRREAPDDSLISAMFTQTLASADECLSDEDILKLLTLVLAAALETTSSVISATIAHLVENPEHVERLLAEPRIWRKAMDEFVRWSSPAACLARTVRHDAEVAGCPIPAGSKMLLLYGSANHDEQEFPDADTVVLDRTPNRHMGFGMGPHRCLGSHLAKAQIALTLERVLPVLADWRIEDPEKITWTAAVTRGMTSLPLVRRSADRMQ
jgi:cytochrome P450